MSTAEPTGHLRSLLSAVVRDLEVGDWRAVLRPPEFRGRPVAGPAHLVHWADALRLVAISMQRQAQGSLGEAWEQLSDAARLLPRDLARLDESTNTVLAVLCPEPSSDAWPDVTLVRDIARLVWREQIELLDLRRTFLPGRMRARDELMAAWTHYQSWVEFDPSTCSSTARADAAWDGVVVDRSRKLLCARGTEIRRFGDSTTSVELSQAPWQDIGGYRGLCAAALDVLAAKPVPAPWCGLPRTSGLVIRRGRLRVWQYALRWKKDLDSS